MSLLSLLGRCGAGPAGRLVLAAACAFVSLTLLGHRPVVADTQDGATVGAVGAVGAVEAVDVVGAVDVLDAVEAVGAEEAAPGDGGAMVAQAAPHVPPLPDAGEATVHGVPPLPAEQRVVSAGGLRPFPAAAAPFDAAGRRGLAMDALTFLVTHQGLLPGRGVYLLPRPNWLGSALFRAPRDAWDLSIPGGVPIYLLAQADPSGAIDPAATTVTVNGVSLPDLGAYIQAGIPALADLGPNDHAMPDVGVRDHAVLDIVFAPPAPGRYRVEVRTASGPAVAYDISVEPPDSLGPLLLRDPGGAVFATLGEQRRSLPNADTGRLLGFREQDIVDASPEALQVLPLGPPLPALRDGMILRQDTSAATGPRQGSPNAADAPGVPPSGAAPWPTNPGLPGVYRLQDGRRIRLGDAGNTSLLDGNVDVGLTVEAAVLQTIPPALLDGTLIKGAGLDIYHVIGGSLRKIPDWRWATERGLRPQATIYVPDRLLATLPQNSPEWVMPGGTWQDRVFHSESLGRPMPYRVYLPPGYNRATEAARRYPVLYLLHGTSGRYEEWSGYGLEEVTNELLAEGRLPEVILVLPQGGLGYWLNHVGPGGTRWADYVARDLVRHVDATYRTLAQREARAIGGLSMGGHGALQLALNYADVFGIAGGHSPSLRARDAALAYFGDEGEFARRDPISLVKESQLAKPPLIWIDTGADDPWLLRLEELHEALQQRGWAHERHVYPGEHDGWYWGDHLWDYLPFYASSFGRLGVPLSGQPR